jgi:hypothetical protein
MVYVSGFILLIQATLDGQIRMYGRGVRKRHAGVTVDILHVAEAL